MINDIGIEKTWTSNQIDKKENISHFTLKRYIKIVDLPRC